MGGLLGEEREVSKEKQINFFPVEGKRKENCADCKYHAFLYDCYYCVNENCDRHGKHEDEFERSDDLCDEGADEDE